MSTIRASFALRGLALRPLVNGTAKPAVYAQRRLAHQDYGSGEGDPHGEKPQKQPVSEKTREVEHPGPAPPKVGQSSGGQQQQQPSEQSQSGEQAQGEGKGGSGARPKIHAESQPDETSGGAQRHNEELENLKAGRN